MQSWTESCKSAFLPSSPMYLPAPQGKQPVSPLPAACLPTGQTEQGRVDQVENLPLGQAVHAVAPSVAKVSVTEPPGQRWQLVPPASAWYS